jgi:hypothetical protein
VAVQEAENLSLARYHSLASYASKILCQALRRKEVVAELKERSYGGVTI